jgi:hypothetical protein
MFWLKKDMTHHPPPTMTTIGNVLGSVTSSIGQGKYAGGDSKLIKIFENNHALLYIVPPASPPPKRGGVVKFLRLIKSDREASATGMLIQRKVAQVFRYGALSVDDIGVTNTFVYGTIHGPGGGTVFRLPKVHPITLRDFQEVARVLLWMHTHTTCVIRGSTVTLFSSHTTNVSRCCWSGSIEHGFAPRWKRRTRMCEICCV